MNVNGNKTIGTTPLQNLINSVICGCLYQCQNQNNVTVIVETSVTVDVDVSVSSINSCPVWDFSWNRHFQCQSTPCTVHVFRSTTRGTHCAEWGPLFQLVDMTGKRVETDSNCPFPLSSPPEVPLSFKAFTSEMEAVLLCFIVPDWRLILTLHLHLPTNVCITLESVPPPPYSQSIWQVEFFLLDLVFPKTTSPQQKYQHHLRLVSSSSLSLYIFVPHHSPFSVLTISLLCSLSLPLFTATQCWVHCYSSRLSAFVWISHIVDLRNLAQKNKIVSTVFVTITKGNLQGNVARKKKRSHVI